MKLLRLLLSGILHHGVNPGIVWTRNIAGIFSGEQNSVAPRFMPTVLPCL